MSGGHASGYEKKDVNIRQILWWTISIVVAVAISLVLLNEYFLSVKEEMIYEEVLKPESVTLRDVRAKEDLLLNSYEVIDSTQGIYRIPIDRAMELIAQEAYRGSRN